MFTVFRKKFGEKVVVGVRRQRQNNKGMRTESIGSWRVGVYR